MESGKIKAFVETTGIIAILVSLLFLGYELKRANEIAEAEATSTVYGMADDFLLTAMTDPILRQTLIKIFNDEAETLNDDEQMIFAAWMTSNYNLVEVSWKYHQRGLMSDDDLALRFSEICILINEIPAIASDWKYRRDTVLPGFYDAVNRECNIENE